MSKIKVMQNAIEKNNSEESQEDKENSLDGN